MKLEADFAALVNNLKYAIAHFNRQRSHFWLFIATFWGNDANLFVCERI